MLLIKYDENDLDNIAEIAADYMKKGKVVIYPTETSYGMGVDATNRQAIQKLKEIKNRPEKQPISILCSSIEMIEKYAVLDEKSKQIIEKYMPGPFTLILEKKKTVLDDINENEIGLRISSNKLSRKICEKMGNPITATSANLHGEPSIYSSKKAKDVFADKVDMIIEAGILEKRNPSTIYDYINKKTLRQGDIFIHE